MPIQGGGKRKRRERGGEESHDRRFNALSRGSQAHSSVNSRDTILHKVKDQACYKSGIMSPEYPALLPLDFEH